MGSEVLQLNAGLQELPELIALAIFLSSYIPDMSTLKCSEDQLFRKGPHMLLSWDHMQKWLIALDCSAASYLPAWAPLIFASASLHAGNKAHRKCTQPECCALRCCHSFCPQSDYCSVQQPSRPLLLREHPDLQQCSGVKDITWGPRAYQAVSIFSASLPYLCSQKKASGDESSLWGYQFVNPEKFSFRTRGVTEALVQTQSVRAWRSGEHLIRYRN